MKTISVLFAQHLEQKTIKQEHRHTQKIYFLCPNQWKVEKPQQLTHFHLKENSFLHISEALGLVKSPSLPLSYVSI